jgi:cytochrome c-type biogenesis protein CcmH
VYKKYLTFALISILLLVPLLLPDDESRFDEWSKSLLCPVCQGETIYDSPSEYADDMRSILQEQINNNMTDNDIYEFWVTRYGEKIITNPIERNYEVVFEEVICLKINGFIHQFLLFYFQFFYLLIYKTILRIHQINQQTWTKFQIKKWKK